MKKIHREKAPFDSQSKMLKSFEKMIRLSALFPIFSDFITFLLQFYEQGTTFYIILYFFLHFLVQLDSDMSLRPLVFDFNVICISLKSYFSKNIFYFHFRLQLAVVPKILYCS